MLIDLKLYWKNLLMIKPHNKTFKQYGKFKILEKF